MKRTVIFLCVGLLVSAMTCGSVWAQGTAQISGTVKDQSGAVLPGVEVTATQTDTGISRMTVSNETG
jgi:Carboxypeptidase regulatory-like domain